MTTEMEVVLMHLRQCLSGNEEGLRLCREVLEYILRREEWAIRHLRKEYGLQQEIVQLKERLGDAVPSGQQPPGKIHDAYTLGDCTNLLPQTEASFCFLYAVLPPNVLTRSALNDLKTQIIALDTRCRRLQQQLHQAQGSTQTPDAPRGQGYAITEEDVDRVARGETTVYRLAYPDEDPG